MDRDIGEWPFFLSLLTQPPPLQHEEPTAKWHPFSISFLLPSVSLSLSLMTKPCVYPPTVSKWDIKKLLREKVLIVATCRPLESMSFRLFQVYETKKNVT